jgi:hypothetical protein
MGRFPLVKLVKKKKIRLKGKTAVEEQYEENCYVEVRFGMEA